MKYVILVGYVDEHLIFYSPLSLYKYVCVCVCVCVCVYTHTVYSKSYMNEILVFFKIVPLTFNTLIPASYPLLKTPLKLFF